MGKRKGPNLEKKCPHHLTKQKVVISEVKQNKNLKDSLKYPMESSVKLVGQFENWTCSVSGLADMLMEVTLACLAVMVVMVLD